MDVNVIFQNSVPIDNNKNFLVKFRDQENIMSLLLNRKKDYFITNAIIYIKTNDKDDDDDDNEKKIKDLEENAKKYKAVEENKKFETIITKKFVLSYDNLGYRSTFKPTYNFKFDEDQMEKYLKRYKYYDTKNRKIDVLKAYDLLANLRQGLVYYYDKSTKGTWSQSPIDEITFTLNKSETQIKVVAIKTAHISYIDYLYKWANRLIMIDTNNFKLVASLTGWVQVFRRILKGLDGFTQAQTASILRAAFAKYFLDNPKALVIAHTKNYQKLNDNEKRLVSFIVTDDGYLRVNYSPRRYFYVGKQLKESFSQNFISKCARPASSIDYFNINIYRTTDTGQVPYLKLWRYLMISTFPSDNYWFDSNAYTIYADFDFPKKIIPDDDKDIVIVNRTFINLSYQSGLSTANLNTIKEFNNFDKYKDLNLEVAKTAYEHTYFLYDNDNLIRETFISELNKKVNLIGSITFYEEINKQGKAFLISNESKLKFDVKKNIVIDSFNFNQSHTHLSGKIDLKKQEIENFMIIATSKLTKTGQKRKMVEVIDTVIVKALQSYEKYSTLNPLEINLNSNYMSKLLTIIKDLHLK